MKKLFNVDNKMVKTGLSAAGKIGKAIVIEGIKGVLLKSATNIITTSFDSGMEGVKKMTIDDYVGKKKKKLIDIPKVEVKSIEAEVEVAAGAENVEKRDLH